MAFSKGSIGKESLLLQKSKTGGTALSGLKIQYHPVLIYREWQQCEDRQTN